ncbi:MAG: YopX family protein [Oscillospiraceae bacterium]
MAEREILFRGKRTDNGEWVEGYVGTAFTIDENRKVKSRHFTVLDCLGCSSQVIVLDETVGQYTGLTDKNGKRIFEGDIVKTHYANAEKSDFIEQIVFHNGKFCAYFSNQLCKQWVNLYDGTEHLPQDKSVYMDSVEVIGNIYDNPELLKGGAE